MTPREKLIQLLAAALYALVEGEPVEPTLSCLAGFLRDFAATVAAETQNQGSAQN